MPLPSIGVTLTFLPSFNIYSLTRPAATPSSTQTSSPLKIVETGTGSFFTAPLTFVVGSTPTSKPEIPLGTAATSINFVSALPLTVPASLNIPGYGFVPSPTSIPGGPGPFSNATSTIIPVFSAGLLGNAYGGGLIKTASLFVTKLPFPNGPTGGVPPGYASTVNSKVSGIIPTQVYATLVGPYRNVSVAISDIIPTITTSAIISLATISADYLSKLESGIASSGTSPSETLFATASLVSVFPGLDYTALPSVIAETQTIISGTNLEGYSAITSTRFAASKPEISIVGSGFEVIPAGVSLTLDIPGASSTAQAGNVPGYSSFEAPDTLSAATFSGTLTGQSGVAVEISAPTLATGAQSAIAIGLPVVQSTSDVSTVKSVAAATAMLGAPTITMPAEGSLVSLASQTLVEIGAVGSPTYTLGEARGAPITLVPGQPAVSMLTPAVSASGLSPVSSENIPIFVSTTTGANGMIYFIPAATAIVSSPLFGVNSMTLPVSMPAETAASVFMPVIGANGATSFALVQAPVSSAVAVLQQSFGANGATITQAPATPSSIEGVQSETGIAPLMLSDISAATVLSAFIGANGATSLTQVIKIAAPTVKGLTPIVEANGVTSYLPAATQSVAIGLTPFVGANGIITFIQVTAPPPMTAAVLTPVVGSNGVTSLVPVPAQPGATEFTPVVGANGLTSLAAVPLSVEQVPAATPGEATATAPAVAFNDITSFSVIPSMPRQSSALMQSEAAGTRPFVGANGVLSFITASTPLGKLSVLTEGLAAGSTLAIIANGHTSYARFGAPSIQTLIPAQPAATVLTPVVGANGVTSLAVIPTPIVGANGLTSLAIFSTPIAAANGVTPPAVILTPVVGANGLTSLAVLATPIVGGNGLTSLAIGMAVEQTVTPTANPTLPILTYHSGGPFTRSSASTISGSGVSGIALQSGSALIVGSSGSSNTSVHAPFSPPPVVEFPGSASKLSISISAGFAGVILLLIILL